MNPNAFKWNQDDIPFGNDVFISVDDEALFNEENSVIICLRIVFILAKRFLGANGH